MQRGFPGFAGNPVLPYPSFQVNAGQDCWIECTFLNRYRVLEQPITLTYRIDDLTDNQVVLGVTIVAPTGTSQEIGIPASLNVMAQQYRSSQLNQVTVVSTYSDGSTDTQIGVYELIAIYSAS